MSGNTLRAIVKRMWQAHSNWASHASPPAECRDELREAVEALWDYCRQEFGDEEIEQENAEGIEQG